MQTHLEVERVFALDHADDVPDLTQISGVARVSEPRVEDLVATYVDTEDLVLTRAGVSLRRRTGGADEGWHLKVPRGADREEIGAPLTRGQSPPAQLRRAVLGWTRGAPLAAVATIATHRTVVELHDVDSVVLAEVADDRVTGTVAGDATPISWRELEVELVDGGADLLDSVSDAILSSGLRLSESQRKIAVVLEGRLPIVEPSIRSGTAGAVLHRRLTEQRDGLLRCDSEVRRGASEGVHQLRVACRRLRSALATFRPLLDQEVTDPLRAELRWVAQMLGEGRDVEVVRRGLLSLVLDEARVYGPVRRRLDRTYRARAREGTRQARAAMESKRYLDLLAALDDLVVATPWTPQAERAKGDASLHGRVTKDFERLRRRVRAAEALRDAGDAAAYDVAVHDVRKAAKRLRYACETLEPVAGKPARRLRKRVKRLTQVLGERQDAVVAAAELVRVADEATAVGESAFTYGRLHAVSRAHAADFDAEFAREWKRARRRKLRAWLT